jgi:hypothetical protein
MRRQYAPTLAGFRVGLSGAIPDRQELEEHGWSELDIRTAVAYVVEAVLQRGGEIVHGNHPTYTPLIRAMARQELGRSERGGRKQVRMYVVGPYVKDVEVAQLCAEHSDYADIELVGPWDREDLGEAECAVGRKEWLRKMRQRMSTYADVLVCIGGKGIRPDVPTPGVLAEAMLMGEREKPVLLAAAIGGFAQSARELLPKLRRDNGLSVEENERLESAGDPSDVTELIIQGLEKLRATSLAPQPATLEPRLEAPAFVVADTDWQQEFYETATRHTDSSKYFLNSNILSKLLTLETKFASMDKAPGPTGNKDSHLQMIQGVIDRMGQNSFSLKGWATTVAAGLFALAASGSQPKVSLLALPSLLVFWLLDAYYLRQEHLYRALFDQVRLEPAPGTDYSMDASGFPVRYAERFWSFSERVFYLPLLALVLLLFAVLTFLS